LKTFLSGIRSCDFVVTAQLPLTPSTTAADIRCAVEALQPVVHAVQISDNTTTQPHMSPLAAASIALNAGMDAVVQLTCRDRNRIALQSDLMGAAALGITSLILSRGEKLPASHKQRIKGVFDIGAQRLLATAQAIGANERLVASPGFFIGSNITAIDPPENWTAAGIDSKADAGSKFVQTQPCLDIGVLRKYMAAVVATKSLERISVIVQVPLLESIDMVDELQNARRPLLIGRDLITRLQQADDFGKEAEGVCSEMLSAVSTVPGISGANVLHRGDTAALVRVVMPLHRGTT
jgi:methylenetetrahydrofolate reductase (NADPH)